MVATSKREMLSTVNSEQRTRLIHAALAVRERAYAPYSGYQVGAALLAADGVIYTGCNVENSSYGLTVCAERNAVFKMVSAGVQRFQAIAIATDNAGSPCGACRQVMTEFAVDIPVILVDKNGDTTDTTLYQLLPMHFGPEHLT